MRLYPYYKLVRVREGQIITDAQLYNELKAEGFEVPKAFKYQPEPYPPAPYPCSNTEYEAYYFEYYKPVEERNEQHREAWLQQFKDFELVLEDNFQFARLVKNDKGEREYRIDVPITYSYRRAASKLLGQYWPAPSDPIKTIAYDNFG